MYFNHLKVWTETESMRIKKEIKVIAYIYFVKHYDVHGQIPPSIPLLNENIITSLTMKYWKQQT